MNEKPAEKSPSRQEPIPVRLLRFRQPTDVPGKTMASSLEANPERPTNKAYYAIDFVPWLRMYKVTFHPLEVGTDGKRLAPKTVMVPESWATWEPARE